MKSQSITAFVACFEADMADPAAFPRPSDCERRVLLCLATSGRALTANEIAVVSGLSYPQTHKAIDRLALFFGHYGAPLRVVRTAEKIGERRSSLYRYQISSKS